MGELTYISNNLIFSVALNATQFAQPKVLATFPEAPFSSSTLHSHAITPDGKRFLMRMVNESVTTEDLHVVLNWPSLVK
ncbi:MAG: hypothetical protein RL328_463 [Acidobacteriota bacterium]|jgi:putative exporter of polyketide antibiotics